MIRPSIVLFTLASLSLVGCSGESGDTTGGSGGSGTIETGSGTTAIGDACLDTPECVPGSMCFNEYCVGQGSLRISLGFEVDSDYDLHVLTPDGSEIYFSNRIAGGGQLDVDQCISTCGTTSHAENVVFDETAMPGTYEVWVVNYDGRGAGPFSIEVAGGVSVAFSGSLTATEDEESTHFTFTY